MASLTYRAAQRMDTQRDLRNVLLFPKVNRLEDLRGGHPVLFSGRLEPLDVLHQCEAPALRVDLLDTSGHQFVHQPARDRHVTTGTHEL